MARQFNFTLDDVDSDNLERALRYEVCKCLQTATKCAVLEANASNEDIAKHYKSLTDYHNDRATYIEGLIVKVFNNSTEV